MHAEQKLSRQTEREREGGVCACCTETEQSSAERERATLASSFLQLWVEPRVKQKIRTKLIARYQI